MPYGGKRPGAGRKKGIKNKPSRAREEILAREGPLPLRVMLDTMRFEYGRAANAQRRLALEPTNQGILNEISAALNRASLKAKDAAPYCHPRLSSIEVAVGAGMNGGGTIRRRVTFNISEPPKMIEGESNSNGHDDGRTIEHEPAAGNGAAEFDDRDRLRTPMDVSQTA